MIDTPRIRHSSDAASSGLVWKTAPFYAMPICAAITNTMGGIVVDGNGAVLDQSDTPNDFAQNPPISRVA